MHIISLPLCVLIYADYFTATDHIYKIGLNVPPSSITCQVTWIILIHVCSSFCFFHCAGAGAAGAAGTAAAAVCCCLEVSCSTYVASCLFRPSTACWLHCSLSICRRNALRVLSTFAPVVHPLRGRPRTRMVSFALVLGLCEHSAAPNLSGLQLQLQMVVLVLVVVVVLMLVIRAPHYRYP